MSSTANTVPPASDPGPAGISTSPTSPHPFDPLTATEIQTAIAVVKAAHGPDLNFNVVSLQEPRKKEMQAWLRGAGERPKRVADVVIIMRGGAVYDGLIDVKGEVVMKWVRVEGAQPIITMEELQIVETICRTTPSVIEQCKLSGIPADSMHKIYSDPWTIGYDARWPSSSGRRLQQALMYYRPHVDACQYQYPLDFVPIYDADLKEIIHIDVPKVRRPVRLDVEEVGYTPKVVEGSMGGYRGDLKPIEIRQPEGVSFVLGGEGGGGRELRWGNWKMHVGFDYREGVVLRDVRWVEKEEQAKGKEGVERGVFWRMSLAEMVVPYGHPEPPHHRKHAFDLGEYGAGYMTNSLSLGCDCKGSIQYLDAEFPTQAGGVRVIKNAICIHEEDAGILFKHTDFRDDSVVVTRGRKLVIQQIFTAANYEYAVQWIFHQDGTIQPLINLTGILNTYTISPGETTHHGTEVYPGVNAHYHQHLFCLRLDANIDSGPGNTVYAVDVVPTDDPVGSDANPYGNAFYAKRTRIETIGQGIMDYDATTGRTWDIVNEDKVNRSSGKAVGYKLVSREVPRLLPKKGSLVWKRAGFARRAVHVTPYQDDQLHPAGRHVPQTSGDPTSPGLPEWIAAATTSAPIANTDLVLWHTFGLTHVPSPEDFPVMPAEPVSLLLRPRNFFTRNPALDVEPSYLSVPSGVAAGRGAERGTTDKVSVLAGVGGKVEGGCCGGKK